MMPRVCIRRGTMPPTPRVVLMEKWWVSPLLETFPILKVVFLFPLWSAGNVRYVALIANPLKPSWERAYPCTAADKAIVLQTLSHENHTWWPWKRHRVPAGPFPAGPFPFGAFHHAPAGPLPAGRTTTLSSPEVRPVMMLAGLQNPPFRLPDLKLRPWNGAFPLFDPHTTEWVHRGIESVLSPRLQNWVPNI
jgi:hypothetical protein